MLVRKNTVFSHGIQYQIGCKITEMKDKWIEDNSMLKMCAWLSDYCRLCASPFSQNTRFCKTLIVYRPKTPVLARSPMLSWLGLGFYLEGWLPDGEDIQTFKRRIGQITPSLAPTHCSIGDPTGSKYFSRHSFRGHWDMQTTPPWIRWWSHCGRVHADLPRLK